MNEYEDEKVLVQLEGIHELLEVLVACIDKDDCCFKEQKCCNEDCKEK